MEKNKTNHIMSKNSTFRSLFDKIMLGALLILFVGFALFALLFAIMYTI